MSEGTNEGTGGRELYAVVDPEDGVELAATREEADALFEDSLERNRDRCDPYHEDVESIALYALRPLREVRLRTLGTPGDGTEAGRTAEANGWDRFARLEETAPARRTLTVSVPEEIASEELEARIVEAVGRVVASELEKALLDARLRP